MFKNKDQKKSMILIGILVVFAFIGIFIMSNQENSVTVIEDVPDTQTGTSGVNTVITIPETDENTPTETKTEVVKTTGQLFLITDKENSRIIEVAENGEVVWQYGCPSVNSMGYCDYGSGKNKLNKPQFAAYDSQDVIITDRENNQVIKVDKNKNVIWSYGGSQGFDDNQLNMPNAAVPLENGNVLIADGLNHRIIEVAENGEVVWQYGCGDLNSAGKCSYGDSLGFLRNPNFVQPLEDGNMLVTDTENNRILEINHDKDIVWEYKSGLNIPQSAYKTEKGTVLIANYRSNIIFEVNQDKETVWEYKNVRIPTFVLETSEGTVVIADSYNNRIIEVDRDNNVLLNINETIEEPQPLFSLFRPQAVVLN